ncbi:hypothetical protein [Alienimonas sp. DA493]|uniref:hypothetical protein n=1 Tax=Alienimonas sp. DA493 TaxID=3373605 RepID=UPI00375425C5
MSFRVALAARLESDLSVPVVVGEPRSGLLKPHVAVFLNEQTYGTLGGDDRSLVPANAELVCRAETDAVADALADDVQAAVEALERIETVGGRRLLAVNPTGRDESPPLSARYPVDDPSPGVTCRYFLQHAPA